MKKLLFTLIFFAMLVIGGCHKNSNTIHYIYKGKKKDPRNYNTSGDTVLTLSDEPRTPSTLDMVPTAADAAKIAWVILKRIYGKKDEDFNTKYKTLEIYLVNDTIWEISAEGTWKVENIDIRKKDAKVLGYYGVKF